MEEIIKEKVNYCLNCPTKPCQKGCPMENDIPLFIQKIKDGKYEEAYQVLSRTTVLQPICGRICPHQSQCQGSCVRGVKGEPTSIGELEAFVGDMALKNNYKFSDEEIVKKDKRVAIIGGGPAGLTCAAFLARKGYEITIYERYNKLGGILNYGIPKFRLNEEIVSKTIEKILNLGIQVKYNKVLGQSISLEELEKNYDAIFLSFGANISSKMNIEGEELQGVFGGNELLEKGIHPDYKGKKVAVIGGGNVAMDCARTIKRLGAQDVYVIYRRSEEEMPAENKEIKEAKDEKVEFLFQNNIVRIIPNKDNMVKEIECIKTMLVKKEGESRAVPEDIEGSNYKIDMDYVVMAIGSKTDEAITEKLGVKISNRGYIQVNENYRTSKLKVFAGGDLVGGKSTVAWAARAGRNASIEIDNFLSK